MPDIPVEMVLNVSSSLHLLKKSFGWKILQSSYPVNRFEVSFSEHELAPRGNFHPYIHP
jgi:hypothetical protein